VTFYVPPQKRTAETITEFTNEHEQTIG
jgi:hypothetical protein